jgi:acyl-CoA synthetase (NDP forming)
MDFEPLINPKVCAIIGASNNPATEGYRFLEGWLANEYRGKIYPVNPKYPEILGLHTYKDIRDIPADMTIDYALIAVPAEKVPFEIQKCIERGVKFAVIFSSGFSEIGETTLEPKILKSAKGSKLRILGPNCIGVYSTEMKLGYFKDQPILEEGPVSFISQSGGITRNFIWTGFSRGFHVRAGVSIGNTIDISVSELLEYFAHDPKTHIIAAYLESVKEGHQFFTLLKKITPQKPVAIMKTGRTPKGKVAAQSHTGAIAGSFEIFASMTKQAGGIVVETLEELTDVILGLKSLGDHLPLGKNIAIINTGGGIAVEMTDICESAGFPVADLEDMTRASLEEFLPLVNVIIKNPVDLGAAGFKPEVLGNVVKILSRDPNIDNVFLLQEVERFQMLNKRFQVPDIGKIYAEVLQKSRNPAKPIIAILPRAWELLENFTIYRNYVEDLLKIEIPNYPTTARAIFALNKLIQYRIFLETHGETHLSKMASKS